MIHLFPKCFLFVLLVCCSHFWLLLRVNASLQLLGYPCFPKGWDTTSYAIQHSLFLAVSLTLSRHTLTSLTHSLSTHLSILVYLLTPSLSHWCVYIYIYIFQTAGWWNPQTRTGARADWAHRDHDHDPEAEGLKTGFTNPPTTPRMRRSSRKTPQPW